MNNNKKTQCPEERVERMNAIFDKLILPMVIFTAAMFIIFGVIPKLASCQKEDNSTAIVEQTAQEDFYTLRSVLLADVEKYRELFEAAGYSVIEDSTNGVLMTYRALETGTEIIDNLTDSSGTRYSVVYRTDPESGFESNIMIYAESLYLVVVTDGESSRSAIFRNDSFVADLSGSDAGQAEVLALVSSESLQSLLEEYVLSMQSVAQVQ